MESNPIQIVMVPRTDLVVPDWNPRKFMEEGPLQVLTDYIAKGGPVPRILAWKGNGVAPFAVISGQRRLEAYKRLDREQVEVEILDITLEEAMIMANTSNDNEALFWLDMYEGWERLKREQVWDQKTTSEKLGKSLGVINNAIRILRVLNAHSRQMIRETLGGPNEAAQKGPKITTSFQTLKRDPDFRPISEGSPTDPGDSTGRWNFNPNTALPLTAFLSANPREDEGDLKAQAQAEKALPIMIARGLTGAQTGQLVGWMKNGNAPETFIVPGKSPKGKRVKSQSTVSGSQQAVSDQRGSNPSTATSKPEIASGYAETSATAPASPDKSSRLSPEALAKGDNDSNHSKNKDMGTTESLLWDGLAGVSVISRIKAKIKKGEKPLWWEAILLAGYTLGRAVIWLAHHAYKLVRPLFKLAGKLVLDALKSIARLFGRTFYQIARVVMMVVLLVGMAWIGWDVYKHGIHHPLRIIESKFWRENPKPQVSIAPVPSPQLALSERSESNGPTPVPMVSIADSPAEPARHNPEPQPELSAHAPQDGKQAAPVPGLPPKAVPNQQGISISSAAAAAQPTIQPVPTVAKNDALGQAVGSVGKQVGAGVAVDVAKKLFGL